MSKDLLKRAGWRMHVVDGKQVWSHPHYPRQVIFKNAKRALDKIGVDQNGIMKKCHDLTDEIVVEIRLQYSMGLGSYRVLADKYGVTWGTIADIVNKKTWRDADVVVATKKQIKYPDYSHMNVDYGN